MSRITIDEYFMQIARAVSWRSTCYDKQVGCVLVDENNHIIATGYNGNPTGMVNCIDAYTQCPNITGDCCYAVHAEQNALLRCDTSKIAKAYCTLEPCISCTIKLMNTACKEIIYAKPTNPKKSGKQPWLNASKIWRQHG